MSAAELQVFLRTKFASAQDHFGFADRLIEVLGEAPTTVLIGPTKNTSESLGLLIDLIADWTMEFNESKHALLYRAVGVDRLSWIMQAGCDIDPTDDVLFVASSPDKALEYGGSDKVLQVFRRDLMDRSYRVFDSDTPPEVIEEVRARFPTEIRTKGGGIHLSRMPLGKFPGAGTGYELEYGWFIPADPKDALQMVIVVGDLPDVLRGAYTAANAALGSASSS